MSIELVALIASVREINRAVKRTFAGSANSKSQIDRLQVFGFWKGRVVIRRMARSAQFRRSPSRLARRLTNRTKELLGGHVR